MTEQRKISFGPNGYKWDYKKTSLENWEKMREHSAKEGRDIGDFPVMTEEEEAEYTKLLEDIK
jgi:hypothetical protein